MSLFIVNIESYPMVKFRSDGWWSGL